MHIHFVQDARDDIEAIFLQGCIEALNSQRGYCLFGKNKAYFYSRVSVIMRKKIFVFISFLLLCNGSAFTETTLSVRKLELDDIKNNISRHEKQGYSFKLLYTYFTRENVPEDVAYLIKGYKPDKFWGITAVKVKGNLKHLKLKENIRFVFITKSKDYLDLILFPDNTAAYKDKNEIGYIFKPITTPGEAMEFTQLTFNEHRPLNPIDYEKFIIKSKEQYLKIKDALLKQFGKDNKNLKIAEENPSTYGITAKKIDVGFRVDALIYFQNSILEYSVIITKYNLFAENQKYYIVNTLPVGNMINAPVTAFESENYTFAQSVQDCIKNSLIKGGYEKLGYKDFFKYEEDKTKISVFP